MIFNLFGKQEDASEHSIFTDRAYATTAAKMNACAELAKDPAYLFICWFTETAEKFKSFFLQKGLDENLITEVRLLGDRKPENKIPVFVEHYPLHAKELDCIRNWGAEKVVVYSALDEPLFRHFGSDKLIPVMKMLGMKEEALIEHNMVTKSILKGQEKIAQQVSLEIPANSQAEWMKKNIK